MVAEFPIFIWHDYLGACYEHSMLLLAAGTHFMIITHAQHSLRHSQQILRPFVVVTLKNVLYVSQGSQKK